MTITFRKKLAFFTLIFYLFSLCRYSYAGPEELLNPAIPSPQQPSQPAEAASVSPNSLLPENSSVDFLQESSPLSLPEQASKPEENARGLERYDFEYAVELLRAEHASAVIVKDLKKGDIEELLSLPFETGIAVLHGEIVLFSTGNSRELGITPAAKALLEDASFISHTHVALDAQSGPSGFDLTHASADLSREYVLTRQGIYAYDSNGVLNADDPYKISEYLSHLHKAQKEEKDRDSTAARETLNRFIAEMDLYNEAQPEDREIYRQSQQLLNSISGAINGGATHTNNANVAVSFTVGESIPAGEQLQMAFSQDGTNFSAFESFAIAKNLLLTGEDGSKTVYIRLKDNAGNLRDLNKLITLDRSDPHFLDSYQPDNFTFQLGIGTRTNFGYSMVPVGNNIAVSDPIRTVPGRSYAGVVELYSPAGALLKTFASPTLTENEFGRGVASDNRYLLIGAPATYSVATGAAFLFDADPSSPNFGNMLKKLVPPLSSYNDAFGEAVVISNGLAFVSAPKFNDFEGRVFVFNADPTNPNFGQYLRQLPRPAGAFNFGASLSVYNNGSVSRILVGGSSGVYLYDSDPASATFGNLKEVLPVPSGAGGFGTALATMPGLFFVGAKQSSGGPGKGFAGKVYVINGNIGTPQFGQIVKTLSPTEPQERGYFGETLKIFENKLYVGAPGEFLSATNFRLGSVDVFYADPSRSEFGELLQHITSTDPFFGYSILPMSDDLFVGIPLTKTVSGGMNGGKISRFKLGERTDGILVNGGREFFNLLSVPLTLNIHDEITQESQLQMAFSENGSDFTSYESFNRQKTVNIAEGSDGLRSIWVRIRDLAGNEATFQKTFILERTAPFPVPGQPVLSIEGGASITNISLSTLNLSIQDNGAPVSALEMAFSINGTNFTSFIPFSNPATSPFSFSNPDGLKTLYVKFRDPAGNVSDIYSDTIFYDKGSPIISNFSINGGAQSTNTLDAVLNITAFDEATSVKEMRYFSRRTGIVTNDVWSEWEPYNTAKNIHLFPFVGDVEVFVQVRDEIGNIATASDLIRVEGPIQAGSLSYKGTGVYELTLNSEFQNLLAQLMPASVTQPFSAGALASVEMQALFQYISEKFSDVFDFVVAFPTFDVLQERFSRFASSMLGSVLGLGTAVRGGIDGIGAGEDDPILTQLNNAFGPLFAQNFSNFLQQIENPSFQQGAAMLEVQSMRGEFNLDGFVNRVLLEEVGHRWLSFLTSGATSTANPLGILGRDNAHWSVFFDAASSPMDGIDWRDNGDGTFTMMRIFGMSVDHFIAYVLGNNPNPQIITEYNDFDLYAMGMLAKEQVAPSFVIDSPSMTNGTGLSEANALQMLFSDSNFVLGSHTIRGVKRTVTIDQIVAIEGVRTPSAAQAQKSFNAAFVIVADDTPQTNPLNLVRNEVTRLAAQFPSIWSTATRGLSTMAMGPAAGAFEAFKNKALTLFDSEANPKIESPAKVQEAEDNLLALDGIDALIQQIESLMTGPAPANFQTIKQQAQQLRAQLAAALVNAENNEAFISAKRTETLNKVLQSAVTALLPAGFGSGMDAVIQQIKNLTTSLQTANSAFGAASSQMISDLTAILNSLGPGAPTVNSTPVATNQSSVTLTGTKSANTSVWINGTQVVASNADTTWSHQVTLSQEQTYNYSVTVKNAANTESSAVNVSIIYDVTAPAVQITSGTTSSAANYALKWTVDGQQKTRNETLNPGNNTLTVTETDAAGNQTTKQITVSYLPPVNPPGVNAPIAVNAPNVLITGTKAANTSVWFNGNQVVARNNSTEWEYMLSFTEEGTYDYAVTLKDALGTESPAVNISILYDHTPPAVVITSSTTSSSANYTLTWTVDGQQKSRNETLNPGTNVLTVVEEDMLANQTTKQITVTYALPAPNPPVVNALPSATNQSTVTLTGTKPANTSVWINGNQVVASNGNTNWSYQVTLSQEQTYNYAVTAKNATTESSAVNVSITYDVTAPVVQITSSAASSSANYTLRWTLDGQQKSRSETLNPGANTLTVTETDAAGNQTIKQITVTYTLPAPNPPVVNALPSATNQSTVTLSGTKPANTSVWINGTQAVASNGSTNWSYQVTLSQEQSYNFAVTTKNATTSSSAVNVSVIYDVTAPNVQITSASTVSSANYTLTWTVDGQQKSRNETLNAGANTLTVTEQDPAGNQTTKQLTVTYEPPAPATGPFNEQAGLLVIEAENPVENITREGKTWTQGTSLPGYSGSGYFQAGPDTGKSSDKTNTSAELKYEVKITTTGTYYVWVLGYAPNDKGDSLHVGLDGVMLSTSDRMTFVSAGSFQWTKNTDSKNRSTMVINSAGTHTLNVWMREDGAVIDKILLTQDPNFIPTGFGPQESTRGSGTPGVNPPTVNSLPAATNQSPLTLTGTKSANTSVWINGIQVVAGNASTSWNYQAAFSQEKTYNYTVTLKNGSGTESAGVNVSIIYDVTAPAVQITSSASVTASSYVLTWTVDGQQKSRNETLNAGDNVLTVTEQDAAGNQTTKQITVHYEPSAPSTGPFKEQGGLLVIEAEHPKESITKGAHTWTEGTSLPGYSGSGYYQVLPDTGKSSDKAANSAELKYDVHITTPGIYYVWVLAYAPNDKGDSFHVGLDGAMLASSDRMMVTPPGSFQWTRTTSDKAPSTMNITSPGAHTLNLFMREDGTVVDKILLTQDPNFVPTGFGPQESQRSSL